MAYIKNLNWVTWKGLQQLKVEASGRDHDNQYFLCKKDNNCIYFELSTPYRKAIENDSFVDMPLPQFTDEVSERDFDDDNPCWGYLSYPECVMIDALFYPLYPQE